MLPLAALSAVASPQTAAALRHANAVVGFRAAAATAAAAAEPAPGHPALPQTWSAKVNQTTTQNGTSVHMLVPGNTQYFQDGKLRHTVAVTTSFFPYAPAAFEGTSLEWMNFTQFTLDGFSGFEINGIHLLSPAANKTRWSDLFVWVPGSTYGGNTTYAGAVVDKWTLSAGGFDFLLLADGNTPVFMNEAGVNGGTHFNISYAFSDFTPNATSSVWDSFTEEPYRNPAVCPGPASPAPVNVSMYIFHPAHNFDIVDQDLGDSAGDVFFTCVDLITNRSSIVDHDYQWLTQWEIELVPRWGQYLNCNGYPPECTGAENWWVGREAGEGLGHGAGGQCDEDKLTGQWWSLPAGGRCAAGKRPGDGSCTWREARRVKTIDGNCLIKHRDYQQACIDGGRAPFQQATAKFEAAFQSDDPAKGGCPALKV